jgi:pantoate--beta-alanine ligase
MQEIARSWKGKSVGLVPTMGALHEGHMSLVRACRQESDIAVASIFVNPTQFGPGEDFEQYPRDWDGDIRKLREARVDTLFMPDGASMYPEGFSTRVEVEGLSEKLCGPFRPGHFSGVATVVAKLLRIINPKRAYFGLKDYQQSLIVKRLVSDLNIPVEIVTCPTAREHDGLAMSSRNQYLTPEERKAAPVIYRCLKETAERITSGARDGREIKGFMAGVLGQEPLIKEVQYASVYDPNTLAELETVDGSALLAVAVRIGSTRLIDNLLVVGV